MSLTEEDKKYILNEYLSIILHVSDREYQERVWIRGEGPEVDDFDETCCGFFDDLHFVFEGYKDFGITDSQYGVLKKFYREFRIFSDEHYHPLEFINTPEWEKIMNLAKEVLRAFNYRTSES